MDSAARQLGRPTRSVIVLRAIAVILGLAAWFGTQQLLGARAFPAGLTEVDMREAAKVLVAGDAVLSATASTNAYLNEHAAWADRLLIASSLLIDLLGCFLLIWAIVGPSLRPFVGLLCLFLLRQMSQVVCALPAPPEMIWRDPGFPSLLVTYEVANDFFFSGHTALAVFGTIELSRLGKKWLTPVAAAIALFEIVAVLVLRAHWTMDVLAGILAALYVSRLAMWLGPRCDGRIARLVSPVDGR